MNRPEYFKIFREHAGQLNSFAHALAWYRAAPPVAPEAAAAWANAGFEPDEALPLIAADVTPEMAAAGDDALVAEHGIVGAALAKVQLEEPGATVLVDPDVEEPQ